MAVVSVNKTAAAPVAVSVADPSVKMSVVAKSVSGGLMSEGGRSRMGGRGGLRGR